MRKSEVSVSVCVYVCVCGGGAIRVNSSGRGYLYYIISSAL